MKVGSLVECVDISNMNNDTIIDYFDVPLKNTVYEIEAFSFLGGIIIKGLYSGTGRISGKEVGYKPERFRELQIPPSITAEIEEALTRELVEV